VVVPTGSSDTAIRLKRRTPLLALPDVRIHLSGIAHDHELLGMRHRKCAQEQRRMLRHALALVLLSLGLDVEAELRVALLLDGVAREERAKRLLVRPNSRVREAVA
jgi:hypothetical protein